MLKDPSGGFIEFIFPAKDCDEVESAPKLYALRNILESAGFDHDSNFLFLLKEV